MKRHLPTPEHVAKLLNGLMGGKTTATKLAAPPPAASTRAVATYLDDAGALACALAVDLACCASLGASLAMIPPGVVQDAVRSGKVPSDLFENFSEVTNIATSLFHADQADHLHLGGCVQCPPALAPAIAKAMAGPASRLALDIVVQGYPPGKMTLLVFG